MRHKTLILFATGLLAALLFSSTFVLNRAMALDGGHWFWSASLRYLYMTFLLVSGLTLLKGVSYVALLLREFCRNWHFWTATSCISFGGFYALLCFASDNAQAWIIAATWQLTIIASLIVLHFFGQKIRRKTWIIMLTILGGVTLVNLSQVNQDNLSDLGLACGCVLLSAILYPLGNQLIWEAGRGARWLPEIPARINGDIFAKVLLLSLGSFPLWGLLFFTLEAGLPTQGQYFNVAIIAVLSGIVATALFLIARNQADSPGQIAAVDASQAAEVVFTLGGEILLLGAGLPGALGLSGIGITLLGLGYLVHVER
jgi:drug/metabolite transporter (DMT)-like permease